MEVKEEGFDPFAFSKLYEWEKNNFWFVSRNERIVYLAKKYLKEPFSFLEVGCGTGFVLEGLFREFKNSKLTGSEFYKEGIDLAQKRNPNLEIIQMDARSIPYSSEFDAIGAFDVIEHIEEDIQVLSQIHKALKKDGYLFITVPQHKFLWSNVDVISYHKRRYTKKELVQKLKQSGFEVLDTNSFTSILFPLMWISRLSQKKQSNPGAEFQISSFVNRVLTLVLKLEFLLIKIGIRFPFGGSLVVVGRKKNKI